MGGPGETQIEADRRLISGADYQAGRELDAGEPHP
jgi:50S ribosomal subunit-associated GTPase HflX